MTNLEPGTIVGGRHRIEALLGQGGFGKVFRATQLALDRPVALKVLLPEALGDEGLQRFQREAEIVQRLEHPNIVRLLDFGVGAGGEPYLVFELLQGQTLEEAIRAGGPLSAARAARVGTQVLKALMEAHARGVVHRDIKPANVFLCNFHGEPDFVKVLDFGIAKGPDSRSLTGRGGVVGTPAYMAPEQVNGGEVGFAADLFALGLTLEEALTGKAVYGGLSLVDIVREHLTPSAVPHAPEVLSSPLGPIIHRATLKKPEMRYPSAGEMLAHLEAAMSFATGGGYVAVPSAGVTPSRQEMAFAPTALPVPGVLVPPPPAPARKRAKPPWALFGAIGGGVALLGGALAGVVMLTGEREKKPPRAAGSVSAASSADAPQEETAWEPLQPDGALVEVSANADGVPDFVGFCGKGLAQNEVGLCAVDGAGFRLLWRKALGIEIGVISHYVLAGAGSRFVLVDPAGVAHVHDAASGAEQGAIRIGSRVTHVCSPPELAGKVWLRTAERGLVVDAAARTASDMARPASCKRGRRELACFERTDPRVCPPDIQEPRTREVSIDFHRVDGAHGVALAHKGNDRNVRFFVGFDPRLPALPARPIDQARDIKILWQQPVVPGDGLDALRDPHMEDFDVRGGRAVAAYDDIKGKSHLVTVDAATGRRLWTATTPSFRNLVLTERRVYLDRWSRVEVYDAATGQPLGGFGKARL